MKTLYESLLDDFEELEKASNNNIKSSIIDFVENNYKGVQRITISDKINDDGKYVVDIKGYTILTKQNIKKLTNDLFIFGTVRGNFSCYSCFNLISLEGGPKEVSGDFKCSHCHSLISLEGAPQKVGADFSCFTCSKLKTLEGGPKEVGGSFVCDRCESLTSLKGGPKEVGHIFNCNNCKELISLEGAPKLVYSFRCSSCKGKFQESDVRKYCKEVVKIICKEF